MRQIRWRRLLAVGMLLVPSAAGAQAPQPKARELLTIPGIYVNTAILMPNRKVVLYATGDSISAYDMATKRTSLITRGWFQVLSVSRQGDRIAYERWSEDGTSRNIWMTPINPRTGAATGPAQRVTTGQGRGPNFSPDGKLIAFSTIRAGGSDVAVVPATGGPERVLARLDRLAVGSSWSTDGKWIFLDVLDRKAFLGPGGEVQYEPIHAVVSRGADRVPAAGGESESMIRYTHAPAGGGEGQIDGQIAFYRADGNAIADGRMAYATASGARGEFQVPPGAEAGFEFAPPALMVRATRPVAAHILTVADGTVRDLLPGSSQGRVGPWSPDGRHLALQTGTSEHLEITVMNSDGSQPRRYPVRVYPTSGHMRWSPDGRMLGYYADADATILAVLDVATGATRVVSSAPPNGAIPDFMWRPDGQSIVLTKDSALSGTRHRAVFEATLDGTERRLRDIGAEFPDARAYFISDRLLLVTTASAQSVVPTSGGTAQSLPGTSHRHPFPGVSSDGRWLLLQVRNTDGHATSVELMTTSGDSLRTLSLPFEVTCCWNAPFHPDGRNLILVGKAQGDSTSKIFLVPMNGDAPRALGAFPNLSGGLYLSPDGTTLALTSEGMFTSTLYELDLSPILQTVARH